MAQFKIYQLTAFLNDKADAGRLTQEIVGSDISIALDTVIVNVECSVYFKAELLTADETLLDAIVAAHSGEPLDYVVPPRTIDNKEIVRQDSRPIGTNPYFSSFGDNTIIGDGTKLAWDFSNDDDIVTSGVPAGYKRKMVEVSFADNVYVKKGAFYFGNALVNSYGTFLMICPDGQYYYDREGTPVLATSDTIVDRFVNKHLFSGDNLNGLHLEVEGVQENPIPPNYKLGLEITVPDTDNISYGWAVFTMYRSRSCLLPGEVL